LEKHISGLVFTVWIWEYCIGIVVGVIGDVGDVGDVGAVGAVVYL
jgi:hypothetical protein